MSTYDRFGTAPRATIARDDTRAVFGHVMGLVAITVGCTALGAYIAKDLHLSAMQKGLMIAVPPLGGSSVVSIRMVVVLPAPFSPRNPYR